MEVQEVEGESQREGHDALFEIRSGKAERTWRAADITARRMTALSAAAAAVVVAAAVELHARADRSRAPTSSSSLSHSFG